MAGAPEGTEGSEDIDRTDGSEEPEAFDLSEELADRRTLTWRERVTAPDRYEVLLLLIIITIVAAVALRGHPWERVVAIALVGLMLVFAMRTSRAPRSLQLAAAALLPILVLATALSAGRLDEEAPIRAAIALAMAALLLTALLAIVRRLTTHLTVSWNTITGALCVYLLFGMLFAAAYAVAGHLQDDLLFVQQEGFDSADAIYFSLITLSTVGFGDLTMRSDVTRIMSAIEALLGQIYLITAVGLLIGNFGRVRRGRRNPLS